MAFEIINLLTYIFSKCLPFDPVRVYMEKTRTVEELQQHIMEEWKLLVECVIGSAVKQSHKRLHACVIATGGHFQHVL